MIFYKFLRFLERFSQYFQGKDVTIREMAEVMKQVVGFKGEIVFDATKPDGAPRKLIDVSRLSDMGWKYSTDLEDGFDITYKWYLNRD